MKTKKISEQWESIPKPTQEKYATIQLGTSNLWLIKDIEGSFGILVTDIRIQPKDKYKNIEISYHKVLRIAPDTLNDCTLLISRNPLLGSYLASALDPHLSDGKRKYSYYEIKEILRLIEQIVKIENASYNEVIGVWGEMHILNKLIDLTPDNDIKTEIIESWEGSASRDIIDLNFDGNEISIEVKTTTQNQRVHHILDLAQLKPKPGHKGYLLSILITQDEHGQSCDDIYHNIKSNLLVNALKILHRKIKLRGEAVARDTRYKFSLVQGEKPLAFEMESVPKPIAPECVTNVEWDVNLEFSRPVSTYELEKIFKDITQA